MKITITTKSGNILNINEDIDFIQFTEDDNELASEYHITIDGIEDALVKYMDYCKDKFGSINNDIAGNANAGSRIKQ